MDLPPSLAPLVFPEAFSPGAFSRTSDGTFYATQPGVALLSRPQISPRAMEAFLEQFASQGQRDFGSNGPWLQDILNNPLSPGSQLAKIAGQICYLSLGDTATKNADAQRYFNNILSQGHGSILEHANYSVLLWGIGRDVTHELVRHRAGFAYSQVSQRYVGADSLRFVERLEFQHDEITHDAFCDRIDDTRRGYQLLIEQLQDVIDIKGMSRTDARKALQQAARSCLTNEVEAPILVTGNVRAWRHCIAMRASKHADLAIRRPIFMVGQMLKKIEPLLFGDFEEMDDLPYVLTSSTPKV